jgi:hypothetical protein
MAKLSLNENPDCIKPCNDKGKVTVRINKNTWIFVDKKLVSTKQKKADYIRNYLKKLQQSKTNY